MLTPLAVDPGHPFPYISNLSISLAVELGDPERGIDHFARVKVPKSLPRWVPIAGRPFHFVPLEHVIASRLPTLFPGMEIRGSYTFRITRYSDLQIANTDEPEDLLAMIEEQVFQRRFGEVVRLDVQTGMPAPLRELLLTELRESDDPEFEPLTTGEVHEPGPLLDMGDLMSLATLDIPELHDPPFTPAVPAAAPRSGALHLRRHPRARPAGAPPVRLVHVHRRAVHRGGRARRQRARDQDDAVSHVG